jgi:hypothetical protein
MRDSFRVVPFRLIFVRFPRAAALARELYVIASANAISITDQQID